LRHFNTNSVHPNATSTAQRREGDISNAFASLSGIQAQPLDPRFAEIKTRLIRGNEAAIEASWDRLLAEIRKETKTIIEKGSSIIPEIPFSELSSAGPTFRSALKKYGVAVIRNVLPESEALQLKSDLREYIAANAERTRAFPPENPQVYELYWSPSQVRARSHPNLLQTQKWLMEEFWHCDPPKPTPVIGGCACSRKQQQYQPPSLISTSHTVTYADRFRIRLPGDNKFALGPHVDGGSLERWEDAGYGGRQPGGVYEAIFSGRWEDFDPWAAAPRLGVNADLYAGTGACSMFRMYQGWLSMSSTGPGEGTLLVNPLFKLATAYYLLRPFFEPIPSSSSSFALASDQQEWRLAQVQTPTLPGSHPGQGQELSPQHHPHLSLNQTMTSLPLVHPGDYVLWHSDTIHAVDPRHSGNSDSSVLYIPICPLTVKNAEALERQRSRFLAGGIGPDFGGEEGLGEKFHKGRCEVGMFVEEEERLGRKEGLRAMGLEAWDSDAEGLSMGQREVMDRANKGLGFYD
jgi:hypothetical protein